MKRYHILDEIRGITLCSMILYHAVWDLVYLFGKKWSWYQSDPAYWWQQSICWSFILLSGFCFSLGRKKWHRGLVILGTGAVVSLVTHIAMPGQSVRFGVLTMLGSSMLLMVLFEKIYDRVASWMDENEGWRESNVRTVLLNPGMGIVVSFSLFFLTRGINERYLGFEEIWLLNLPSELYQHGNLMTYIGFMSEGFYSTDYFSIMPWFFLFSTGYFLYHLLKSITGLQWLSRLSVLGKPFCFMGRHSLLIYMLHQPVIFGLLSLVNKLITI